MIILIAWCLAMLSQTQTHCAQPLQRSTATYADPYFSPFSFPESLLYRMVLASGQNCVQSLQLVAAQISTLISATRYMTPLSELDFRRGCSGFRLLRLLCSLTHFVPAVLLRVFPPGLDHRHVLVNQ